MTLADCSIAKHDSKFIFRHPRLIRVFDETRIADGGAFDRVFVRECSTEQASSIQRDHVGDVINHPIRVRVENLRQVLVAMFEARQELGDLAFNLSLAEREHPFDCARCT
ncbi:MAG: hypothetical protein ACYDEH_00860 [Acidimicrobiales bacterium]